MITLEKKRQIYNKYKDIIGFIYFLAGNVILKKHLIIVIKSFKSCGDTTANNIIDELINNDILKVGKTYYNSAILILPKPIVGIIQGKRSCEVTTYSIKDAKVYYSAYKVAYIIKNYLDTYHDTLSIRRALARDKSTLTYLKNNTSKYYNLLLKKFISEEFFNNDFYRDFYFYSYSENSRKKDVEIAVDWEIGYKLRKEVLYNYKRTHGTESDFELKYFYTFNNLVTSNFFVENITLYDNTLNIQLGYFDAVETKDTANIYKSATYILNMFNSYLNKDRYSVRIDYFTLNIYCATEERVKALRRDSDMSVVDFKMGCPKKYKKAKNAIYNAYKGQRNEYIEQIKYNFKLLDI